MKAFFLFCAIAVASPQYDLAAAELDVKEANLSVFKEEGEDQEEEKEPEEEKDQGPRRVLMVIDMIRDYCSTCTPKGASTCKWQEDIHDLAEKIGKELEAGYDLIVFTKDLDLSDDAGSCFQKGTDGYKVVEEIWNQIPDNVEFLTWAKDTDDWFTGDNIYEQMYDSDFSAYVTLDYIQWGNKRHFDLEDPQDDTANTMEELLGSHKIREEQKTSFVKINGQVTRLSELDNQQKGKLERYDFKRANTEIVVTGIMLTRCVLKGAVHAAHKGWKVEVREDLTDLEEEKGWYAAPGHVFHNKPITTYGHVNIGHAPPAECTVFDADEKRKTCEKGSVGHGKWMVNVFAGHKGGPSKEEAPKYLKQAGVAFVNKTNLPLSENISEENVPPPEEVSSEDGLQNIENQPPSSSKPILRRINNQRSYRTVRIAGEVFGQNDERTNPMQTDVSKNKRKSTK